MRKFVKYLRTFADLATHPQILRGARIVIRLAVLAGALEPDLAAVFIAVIRLLQVVRA